MAEDIYDEMDERICGDIDILIEKTQFKEYNAVLEKLGYEHEFADSFERCYKKFCQRHVRYHRDTGIFPILIEVHSAVVNPADLFHCDSELFIRNARSLAAFGLKTLTLGIEYNLIMLMLHFFKHLPTDYFQKAVTNQETEINLSNLYDIALFVQKYREKMNWQKVIEIGRKMMVVKYLYMDSIGEMTLEKAVLGKLPERMSLLGEASQNGKYFFLGEKESLKFEEEYKLDFPYAQIAGADVNLKVFLDGRALKVVYGVKDKTCCYLKNPDQMPVSKYRRGESMEIMIIKGEHIVHRLFTAAENETGQFIFCRYFIPWEFLEVNPQEEEKIGFNVRVVLPDPGETAAWKTCCLFCGENFWDFRGTGIVEFIQGEK